MSKCQEHVAQRVCVPACAPLVCVSICAHERLSLQLSAYMCRSCAFYAASIRLNADPEPEFVLLRVLFLILSLSFFSLHVLPSLQSLQETLPLHCQSGLATIISSSAAPAFSPSIPHSSPPSLSLPRTASVRRTSTDGA